MTKYTKATELVIDEREQEKLKGGGDREVKGESSKQKVSTDSLSHSEMTD